MLLDWGGVGGPAVFTAVDNWPGGDSIPEILGVCSWNWHGGGSAAVAWKAVV